MSQKDLGINITSILNWYSDYLNDSTPSKEEKSYTMASDTTLKKRKE